MRQSFVPLIVSKGGILGSLQALHWNKRNFQNATTSSFATALVPLLPYEAIHTRRLLDTI